MRCSPTEPRYSSEVIFLSAIEGLPREGVPGQAVLLQEQEGFGSPCTAAVVTLQLLPSLANLPLAANNDCPEATPSEILEELLNCGIFTLQELVWRTVSPQICFIEKSVFRLTFLFCWLQ